jgi:hypothetical protein
MNSDKFPRSLPKSLPKLPSALLSKFVSKNLFGVHWWSGKGYGYAELIYFNQKVN